MPGDDPPQMTFAAGGLVWAEVTEDGPAADGHDTATDSQERLAVVHRPRYDDWSLPKGKVEADELLPETAVREVREETGLAVRRETFAGRYQYDVEAGPKTVFVWHMRVVDDVGPPDDEVDEVAWLTPDESLGRLSYALERDLVERFLDSRPE